MIIFLSTLGWYLMAVGIAVITFPIKEAHEKEITPPVRTYPE
jgi:hypothetical protein